MTTRITGAEVRDEAAARTTRVAFSNEAVVLVDRAWLYRIADSLDAPTTDAAELAALRELTVATNLTIAQLRRRNEELEQSNTAMFNMHNQWESSAKKNEAEAEQFQAIEKILNHKMRNHSSGLLWLNGGWSCYVGHQSRPPDAVNASTPVELLAKLDALAEAAKPKAERWRWRFPDGSVSSSTWPSAEACGPHYCDRGPGDPVREVVRSDGVIELHPEGT